MEVRFISSSYLRLFISADPVSERGLEHPEVLITEYLSEVLLGFKESASGPSQGHGASLPLSDPTRPQSHVGMGAVDDVGDSQTAPQRWNNSIGSIECAIPLPRRLPRLHSATLRLSQPD